MSKKSPAASGAKITAADIEAAERDRVVAASLKFQQAMATPPPSPPDSDTAKVLAALDRLERPPTGDELASRMDAARRQDVARRNAEGEAARRAYAARVAAGTATDPALAMVMDLAADAEPEAR